MSTPSLGLIPLQSNKILSNMMLLVMIQIDVYNNMQKQNKK